MRQFAKWFLLVIIICAIAWMLNVSIKKVKTLKVNGEKMSLLPELKLLDFDSAVVNRSVFSPENIVLVHFNSECSHCHYEAQDIKNYIKEFSGTTIIFMSSESLHKIKVFAEVVGLRDHENVLFTKISDESFEALGALSVPHIFIYGSDKVLRKEFKGETKAEAILKYLN